MKYRYLSLALVLTPFLITTLHAQTVDDCGAFRTQTQGGWGTIASGNNPGTYRDSRFDEAFPYGLTIGCDETMHFTSSQAIENFLPSGGSPAKLTESTIDPEHGENVLAAQVLALTLSVGFDAADPSFSPADIPLSSLTITQGQFAGYSVEEILQLANEILGTCNSSFSPSEINEVISAINENFVDGTMDGGFLECPEVEVTELYCELNLGAVTATCIDEYHYSVELSISGRNGGYKLLSQNALSGNNQSICFDTAATMLSVTLTFAMHDDYDFEIVSDEASHCSVSSIDQCAIEWASGPPPSCCDLIIECPWNDIVTLDCLSAIPSADPNAIVLTDSCGLVSINYSESQYGAGCASDPLFFTRSYTITDGVQTASCLERYRIVDDEAPMITCPVDEVVSCSSGTLFPSEWAVATDNCDESLTIYFMDLPSSSCESFTRSWIARDDCNNTASCQQTISFTDNTPPNLFVPQDRQIDCLANASPINTGQATANDICSAVELSYEDSIAEVDGCTSEIYRTWLAMDACGNSAIGIQRITRTDMTGPVISNLAPGTSLQCGEVPPPDDPIAVDACSGDTLVVNLEELIQEDGCEITYRRIYTAIDSCGNATTRLRIITIADTQAPDLTCPDDVTLSCGDIDYTPSITGTAEAEDNCSGTTVEISFDDSDLNMNACPPEIIRQWTATDECGNVATCIQHIYFLDTSMPTIECPSDISITCDGEMSLDPANTGVALGSDECSATTVTYTDSPMSGSCPMTFERTWIVSDACFNFVNCSQMITVIDTVAPIITCPDDILISCAYSDALPSLTGTPTVSGECLEVTFDYVDGDITGECTKSFSRTWTATDICGNSAQCVQLITFFDNMPPVVFCPSDTLVSCAADLSPEFIGTATAIDYCNDVTVSYVDDFLDDGCASYMERTWTATDVCGNTASCIQTIQLSSDNSVSVDCPSDITVSTLADAIPAVTGSPIVDAQCSTVVMTYTDVLTTLGSEDSEVGVCGTLRTQTQGGWGTTAHGGNPGVYRDAHFDEAFPDGLVVGCDYELTLSSSAAVQHFLPCGGTPASLDSSIVDPTELKNVLAGQLVALTLSVNFDLNDSDFGASDINLADMIIGFGPFEGWTVAQVLAEANAVFGACASSYSASDMVQVLSSINENFVDGSTDNGFLECPGDTSEEIEQLLIEREWTIIAGCQDTVYCEQTILVENPIAPMEVNMKLHAYPSPTTGSLMVEVPLGITEGSIIHLYDMHGNLVLTQNHAAGQGPFLMDISSVEPGMYMLDWVSEGIRLSTQIVRY